MTKLMMICGGLLSTVDNVRQLDIDYSMNDHARAMCWVISNTIGLIDDNVPTDDEHFLVDSSM